MFKNKKFYNEGAKLGAKGENAVLFDIENKIRDIKKQVDKLSICYLERVLFSF